MQKFQFTASNTPCRLKESYITSIYKYFQFIVHRENSELPWERTMGEWSKVFKKNKTGKYA